MSMSDAGVRRKRAVVWSASRDQPGLLEGVFEGPASQKLIKDAVSELDRLEAEMSECREMIREAHAATKDLRAAVREAEQEACALAPDDVAAHIQAEVSRQLEELGERTREAVTAATQKVIIEFDRFGEALLGKETCCQRPAAVVRLRTPTPTWCRPSSGPATTRVDRLGQIGVVDGQG